jgi:DNA-binding protein YbaB
MSRLRQFQEEANRLSVEAHSDDELISVVVHGTGEVEVHLRPGALRGTTEAAVAKKLNRAIGDAMWQLRLAYRETSRQTLGTD